MMISESLDQALGDIKFSHEHSEKITTILAQVRDLKKQLANAENELANSVDGMYAQLATAIRKLQPNIIVSLQKNGCIVGFKTKCLSCTANPHTGKWDFSPGEFGKIFNKRYGNCPIDSSLDDIAKNIVDFFGAHYKSLAISA